MATIDDRSMGIAQLYARSMLEVAEERGAADALLEELGELSQALDQEGLASFLESPTIDSRDRAATLERMFRGRASDLLVDSLGVINQKGRLGLLPAIIEGYRQAHRDARGKVDVYVTSAVELSDSVRMRLKAAADRFTGKDATLHEQVDPAVLGGLVVRVEDQKIDSSVSRRLERLSGQFATRASAEILRSRAESA